MRSPVESEPVHRVEDRVDVLGAPPSPGWCRRSAGGTRRRSRAPARSSGRSTWRGRCADSRWARAGSACGSAPDRAVRRPARLAVPGWPAQVRAAYLPLARSCSTMLRMKLVTWPSPLGGGALEGAGAGHEVRRGGAACAANLAILPYSLRLTAEARRRRGRAKKIGTQRLTSSSRRLQVSRAQQPNGMKRRAMAANARRRSACHSCRLFLCVPPRLCGER